MLAMNERFYSWLMTIPFSCSVCATVRSKPKPTAKKCGHVPLNAFSTASVVTMPLFTESIVDALRKSAFHHAELRTCLSMRVWRMAWATSKVVTKLCLEQELEQSTKIERIHQDLHEIKVYILQGLAIHLASSLQEDTKTNPKLTAAMAEHSMLHASVAISLPFELSPWNWLKYVDIDFGIKHLAQCEPFYQFILLFATTCVLSLQKILT